MCLNDPVTDAQAQSRPLTRRLRSEEWLEDALTYRLRHPVAGVGDDDGNGAVSSTCDERKVPNLCISERRLGVDEEIQQYLLELLFITANLGIRIIQMSVDLDSRRA